MVVGFPNFWKLDSNDEWVESCGSTQCSQNHNIRKNAIILPPTCMDMNRLDFLDVIDYYRQERVAVCNFCKNCHECRRFKRLCAKAWGITLNSWRKKARSYFVAVRFNCLNQKYPKTLSMTVDIYYRKIISVHEEKLLYKRNKKFCMKKLKYREIKKW